MSAISCETKPTALSVSVETIPDALKAMPNWVVWQYTPETDPQTGKVIADPETGRIAWDKPPARSDGKGLAKSNDPMTWAPFPEAAVAFRQKGFDGLGIVLHVRIDANGDAHLVGVDLDDCRDPVTRVVEQWAIEIVQLLNSYTEISPSGRGLRIFVFGRLPPFGRKKGKFEVYETGRYVTVTGQHFVGTPLTVEHRQEELLRIHKQFFGDGRPADVERGLVPPSNLADAELIQRASAAKNGEKFRHLWEGNLTGHGSASEADLALCNHLAFWCGPNEDRIAELFAQSGLFRSKWQREDYRHRTIQKALAGRTEFFKGKRSAVRNGEPHTNGHHPSGNGCSPEKPAADAAPVAPEDEQAPSNDNVATAHNIIIEYLRERYRPVFRVGNAIYSEALQREVKVTEAASTPEHKIIEHLFSAVNVPKTKKGLVDYNKLPVFHSTWCKVAWGTLLSRLPDEEMAEEIAESAEAEFQDKVRGGLLSLITIGVPRKRGAEPVPERRTALAWATLFAKGGRWQSVRSYDLWSRMAPTPSGMPRFEVAVTKDFFDQMKYAPLAGMSVTKFSRLCARYRVGTTGEKAQGKRAVVLTEDFLLSMQTNLNHDREEEAQQDYDSAGSNQFAGGSKTAT